MVFSGHHPFSYEMQEKIMRVRFHLPGLRYNYPLNMIVLAMLKQFPEYFREGIEIASFFGEFPMSLWNGGRQTLNDQCDARFVREVIKSINAQGVPVRFTYTNPVLEKEDLNDPYCNFCLKCADNGMNEVIVVSPILEEYIRKNYPGFKLNSSTCKEIRDIEGVQKELERDYHMIVLDYNLNNQFELLEQIRPELRSKVELLINAVCVPNCPRRGEHYKTIGINERIAYKNRQLLPSQQVPIIPWECHYGEGNCIYEIQKYNTYISPEDIWNRYVPMGFENFKIEGRTANLFSLVETYSHYLAKPEKAGEFRMQVLNHLVNNRILTINKPRRAAWDPES